MPIDYSKWNNIEISDDEDDTHPNIDTPSLFKWRHEARIEREKTQANEKAQLRAELHKAKADTIELKTKMEEGKNVDQATVDEAQQQYERYLEKERELEYQEKNFPKWNVDNISHEGFDKTIINPNASKTNDVGKEKSEDEQVVSFQDFVNKHKPDIIKFGMLSSWADSYTFLTESPQLVNEHTAGFLVIYCVDLEVEKKTTLMKRVARQCISMQFIMQIATTVDRHPVEAMRSFYKRIQTLKEAEYLTAFNDELNAFIARVQKRAVERYEEALAEVQADEEAERRAAVGPGGLNPYDVADSLPESMRKAFEARDMPMLHAALADLDPEEARYHIKRCADSGLWVPSPGALDDITSNSNGSENNDKSKENDDVIYADAEKITTTS